MLQITDLRTEYLTNPIAIDAMQPRFSWKLKSKRQGVVQINYRIIATSGDLVIWDSGIVESDQCLYVRYEGRPLISRQQVSWKVKVTVADENQVMEESESEAATFEMGLLHKEDWQAKWIEPETEIDADAKKPAPYLRKTFEVKSGLKKARIYSTAHGLYEFWINGQLGTEDKFKPGLTSYYYRIQYQAYDITSLLIEGTNVWSVMLGDGWWRGVTGGTVKNNFGYKLHYFGQIELYYEDGTHEIIGTDESFCHSTGGMLASDMIMGDIFDANIEPSSWKLAQFDDGSWESVHLTDERTDAQLIPSRGVPVREKEQFHPVELIDKNGKRILDFGQNIAGYVVMKLRNCQKGQQIRLVFGEDMKDGCFSLDNIIQTSLKIDAFQEVTYISAGDNVEVYCPLFSYFGFRYVMLEGYDGEIQEDDFVAIAVYSDMEESGDFTCSNPLINKLVENSRWSQKGNFLDVAVDCPTREKNAWTGDNQIYVRTATYFMDVYSFYEKWLQDQAIEQYESGKLGITFPSTSSVHNPIELEAAKELNPMSALAGPTGNGSIGEDCAGWGDSAAWIPYMIYLSYGDKQIVENHYETAKKWVDYMLTCAKDRNPLYEDQPQYNTYDEDGALEADYIYDTKLHYGEWLEPIAKESTGESVAETLMRWYKEGKPLVATAYMCRSASNVAHMAQIIGKEADAKKYSRIADKIRTVYEKYLIGDDGVIEPGHQAAYVRALAMNLCTGVKKEAVIKQLLHEIEANDYKLNTGFLSTPFLLPVLVDHGFTEIAFRILEQTESPSWLHPVLLGSTTILENWNGMDTHSGSFNHYSYGSVCEFLFGRVGGITPLFEKPGYKEFELRPTLGGSLTHASAKYDSLYGTIISEWKRDESSWKYYCVIPVNTRAKVVLPDGTERLLGSGQYQFGGLL